MSGVPLRHYDKDFNILMSHKGFSDKLAKCLPAVTRRSTLVLLGNRGVGKTQMAVELIRLASFNGKYGKYIRCREIGMKLREAYGNSSKLTEKAAIDQFIKPWLLVIDECQELPDSDWESKSLTMLIDSRYGALRPTIMLANCESPEKFLALMGPSIYDRVFEGGNYVVLDWKSLRGNALWQETTGLKKT